MRETDYARELVDPAILTLDAENEARIELLHVHETNDDEYRFSWWKNDKLMPRALDLNEDHLIGLLERGIADGVFRESFLDRLRGLLQASEAAV